MSLAKQSDLYGRSEVTRRLKAERAIYGLDRNSRVSKHLADALSQNFEEDFIDDPISLSDRRDFKELGDHYDPIHNVVRSNLRKTSPAVLAHELGHAFTMGREARGQAGLAEKLKYYTRLMSGVAGHVGISAGVADLVAAAKNKSSYMRGGILTGLGLAANIGSAVSRYRDETRATTRGLDSLRKTLSNPEGVIVSSGGRRRLLTPEQVQSAMAAGEASLDAALGTYRRALPVQTAISSGISGLLGAAVSSMSGLPGDALVQTAAMSGLVPAAIATGVLENAMRSRPGSPDREEAYKKIGDGAISILTSRRR